MLRSGRLAPFRVSPIQRIFIDIRAAVLLTEGNASSQKHSSPSQQLPSQQSTKPTVGSSLRPPPTTVPPKLPTKQTIHEDIYTIPNILTFTRLAAAPAIGYLVLQDSYAWATGLLAYAGITDLLDGWIARKWNTQTVVGTVIDPMADKALMTILTVCLAVKGALPSMCDLLWRGGVCRVLMLVGL